MYGFDDLWIWGDPDFAGRLGWYRNVAADRRPAKFRICATVPTAIELAAADEATLWAELDRLTLVLLERWRGVREGAPLGPRSEGTSLLDLCRELALRMLTHCNFCRWDCGVDRSLGR